MSEHRESPHEVVIVLRKRRWDAVRFQNTKTGAWRTGVVWNFDLGASKLYLKTGLQWRAAAWFVRSLGWLLGGR